MTEQQPQAQQQQQQQDMEEDQREEINNESHLPSDWFYSSVMLTNRLDIGVHASVCGCQMDHPDRTNPSSLTLSNLPDPKFLHICQNADVSSVKYPGIVTTTSSSSSPFNKSSFQTNCLESTIPHEKFIQSHDMVTNGTASISDDTKFAYTSVNSPTFQMPDRSRKSNYSDTLQMPYRSRCGQRANVSKSLSTMICKDNVVSCGSKKNDNFQLEKVQKVEVEDSDDGDGREAPPNVLYSHSTTNSSDKMNWDCSVRWPSAKGTGVLTSSYSVSSIDAHGDSGTLDNGKTASRDIGSGAGMVESIMIDAHSQVCGNIEKIIQETEIVATNTVVNSDRSKDINVRKSTMETRSESNLTDATITVTAAASSPSAVPLKVGSDEKPSSPAVSHEVLLLPSIKTPIKKRLLHNSFYNDSEKTTSTCTGILRNTYVTVSEYNQFLPTTIASCATVTSTATESVFSSCYQMAETGSTGTMINEDPMPPVTTYPNLLTNNSDVFGSVLNDQAVRLGSHSNQLPLAMANSLSEAEIVNLLCRNLCDIERIVAQQRIANSGASVIQLPSLMSQCNGEQKSQVSYTGSVILPDHQQHQQQDYHHYHNIAVDQPRSGTIDCSDTRRYHPYATTTTSLTTTPSRADLKQKYLRSLAPVLYDLLTDDCESKTGQKTTDSMDCSILKNCVEPFMDAYLRSLSLLAATASPPITASKFDQPFNYIDYLALQQCSLLLGSAPVTSTDLLKLVQSANLLYNATIITTPTTNPGTALSDKIPFINKISQVVFQI